MHGSFTHLTSPSSNTITSFYANNHTEVYEIHLPVDTDGDGVDDSVDNCVGVSNTDQADADGDLIGDACDQPAASPTPLPPPLDSDGDGIVDTSDNCPNTANADQANADNDNLGNACDPDFGEGQAPPSEGKGSGCSLSIFSTPGTSLISWFTFLPLMLMSL